MGYSPNWQNLKGSGTVVNDDTKMTPSIEIGNTEINRNENVALFFENSGKIKNANRNKTKYGKLGIALKKIKIMRIEIKVLEIMLSGKRV